MTGSIESDQLIDQVPHLMLGIPAKQPHFITELIQKPSSPNFTLKVFISFTKMIR